MKTKNKRSSPQFGTIFDRTLWDLFVLTGPFSSDYPALKSQWGTLTLDGGTRPPYNLSTEYIVLHPLFSTKAFFNKIVQKL